VAYRADIEIAVRGAQELKRLQNEINNTSKLVKSLNDYIENFSGTGIVRSINTLRQTVAGAASEFNKVALGTEEAVIAARKYVSATNELNAELRERAALLKTINEEERKNRLAQAGIREKSQYVGPIGPGPASPVGALVGQKSPVEERIKRTLAGRQDELQLEQALLRLEEKSAEQLNRQLQTRKELARTAALEVNTLIARAAAGPQAAQLLLSAAAPGAPAMGGGARRRITGPVERLGGARTVDEAAMALRFAQALQQQARPLSQIESLYAGIAGEAAKLQRIKALPDTAMLNASARGIKQLQTAEDMLNTERQESVARLEQIDRLEASRARRARKLQERQQYMAGEPIQTAAGPGFGAGLRGRAGGAVSSAIIGGGFPLLFGQGPAAAAGGALGGLAGGLLGGGFGFALSIAGTAIGDLITQSETLDRSLGSLNSSLSSTGATSLTTATDVKQLAKDLQITNDEAIQLVGTFSQFGDAQTREALASLFGGVGGAATFEAIARAGIDEKEALNSIFELRKYIGNEAANQLALQLKTVGATQTQATLLKLVVERSIQSATAAAQQVKFTDNLLSTWENIVAGVAGALSLAIQFIQKMREGSLLRLPFLDQLISLLGGVKARSGKQIAEQNSKAVEDRMKAAVDAALKAVKQETGVLGTQNMLQDRMQNKDSDKAAKKAAEEAKRVSEVVRDRTAETELLQVQQQLQTRIFNAEQNKDLMLAARLKGEQEILDIQFKYAQELAKEPNIRAQTAIINKGLQEIDNSRVRTAQQLQAIETAQAEAVQNMLQDMELEIIKTQAKTDAQKQAAQVMEIELQFLRQGKTLTKDQVTAIATKIAELEKAKKLQAEATALLRMETELFDSLASNVASAFNSAITSAVQGTEDLGAALQNIGAQLLGTIGNMLIMYGIAQALGAAGGGVGNPEGILSFLARGFGFGKAAEGAYWQGGFQAFADGGMVNRPTMGLVGEGGEAEYIIPASKMRGAMARYASGARGSAVIPSGGDTGGDMGGVAVASGATVDVRYTVERINSVDYVTADQFQRGMAQAAQQGANQGEQRALRALQNNRSTRSRLGLR